MKNIRTYLSFLENEHIKKLTEVKPGRFLFHLSNPLFRDEIAKHGLSPQEKSDNWLEDTPITGKVLFATDSERKEDMFNSGYDDDVYQIDTMKIPLVKWYIDPNFEDDWPNTRHIFTRQHIPLQAINLIYRGTGNLIEGEDFQKSDDYIRFWGDCPR